MEIYCITNLLNGMRYVGSTMMGHQRRFKAHCFCPNLRVGAAIREYGKENFSVEVLETLADEYDRSQEVVWIDKLNTWQPNGYNAKSGAKLMSATRKKNRAISLTDAQYGHLQAMAAESKTAGVSAYLTKVLGL